MKLLRFLFGLSATVNRKQYAITGVTLMVLKLLIDNAISYFGAQKPWPLAAYLLPSVYVKTEALRGSAHADTLLVVMAIVTLPFIWIGVSMSVRRAADAGQPAFVGLLFLIPILNYIIMITFALLPSAATGSRWIAPPPRGPYRAAAPGAPAPSDAGPESVAPDSLPRRPLEPMTRSVLLGLVASVAIGLGMVGLSIFSMQLYGTALFFGTPFLMGVTTAYIYNHRAPRGLAGSIGLAVLSIALTGLIIMLFAIEGAICLAMAFPIAAVLAIFGAIVGWALARQSTSKPSHAAASLLFLPGLATAEHATAKPELHAVTTIIEIDATPDKVWNNVIGFSELPAPSEFYFKAGIAYPMRAKIHGEGVGAIRHCEFSTGPFVEPITVWDKPLTPESNGRLAFDVTSQPPSMSELSPYKNVKAAHLEGYMTSKQGEFRLTALPGGRTRLEGTTWYTLAIYPEGYWRIFGERLLHSIHGRVLDHIKDLTEHPK